MSGTGYGTIITLSVGTGDWGDNDMTVTCAYRTRRFPDVVPCSNSTLWTPSLRWISHTATRSPVPTSSIAG